MSTPARPLIILIISLQEFLMSLTFFQNTNHSLTDMVYDRIPPIYIKGSDNATLIFRSKKLSMVNMFFRAEI